MELTPSWHAAHDAGRARRSSWGRPGEITTYAELEDRSTPVRAGAARPRGRRPATTSPCSWRTTGRSSRCLWAAQRSGLHYTAINSHLRAGRGAVRPRRLRRASRSCRPRRWPTSSPASTCRASRCGSSAVGDLAGLRALRRRARRRRTPARSTTSARAGRCSTRRARPGGPRACASRCPGTPFGDPVGGAGADRAGHRRMYGVGPGLRVPLARAAVPRRAARLLDVDAPPRRHGRGDGAVRPAPVPRADRAPPGDPRPVRADDVRPHAPAARGGARRATTCRACSSSMHAAAPCPVAVKRQMIDWWGPIIHEYYSGTEDIGSTFITRAGVARPPGLGRSAAGRVPHRRRGRRGAAAGRGRASCTSPAGGRSSTTTTPRRPRRSPTTRAGGRSATSATSTRTATCTSPTARPT